MGVKQGDEFLPDGHLTASVGGSQWVWSERGCSHTARLEEAREEEAEVAIACDGLNRGLKAAHVLEFVLAGCAGECALGHFFFAFAAVSLCALRFRP